MKARTIELVTIMHAPAERCFNLARSIDFHRYTMNHTHEKAVDGVVTGLINKNERVCWEAKHFGINQKLISEITELTDGKSFTDEMIKGPFKSLKHDHTFSEDSGKTIMNDHFTYEVSYGLPGMVFDYLVLYRYLKKLLTRRNTKLKNAVESDEWQQFLKT